jgi:DNA-binding NarL/FixJ family response regulator
VVIRLIMTVEPRLMRDLLKHVFAKIPDLEVVGETTENNWPDISGMIQQTDADWVLMTLLPNDCLPEGAHSLLHNHPSLAVFALAADGSHAKMKWEDFKESILKDISLEELIWVLRDRTAPKYWH